MSSPLYIRPVDGNEWYYVGQIANIAARKGSGETYNYYIDLERGAWE